MSVSGISAGVGGAGGITPGAPKGVSDVGQAKESDVSKFKESMGSESTKMPTQAQSPTEAKSPLDIQANRITDSSVVQKPVTSHPSLGKEIMQDISKMISAGRNQEATLKDKLVANGDKPFSQKDAMLIQYEMSNMSILTDVVGKGANKFVTAVQSMAKNQ